MKGIILWNLMEFFINFISNQGSLRRFFITTSMPSLANKTSNCLLHLILILFGYKHLDFELSVLYLFKIFLPDSLNLYGVCYNVYFFMSIFTNLDLSIFFKVNFGESFFNFVCFFKEPALYFILWILFSVSFIPTLCFFICFHLLLWEFIRSYFSSA